MFLAYITMFFTALISATLIPMGSEVLLVTYSNYYNIYILLLLASIGNILGSLINYFLGKKGISYILKKKMITEKKYKQSEKIFIKYGGYSLFLSWMPIIGDPLTFIAGILKFNIWKFLIIVSIAKFLRYAVLLFIFIK